MSGLTTLLARKTPSLAGSSNPAELVRHPQQLFRLRVGRALSNPSLSTHSVFNSYPSTATISTAKNLFKRGIHTSTSPRAGPARRGGSIPFLFANTPRRQLIHNNYSMFTKTDAFMVSRRNFSIGTAIKVFGRASVAAGGVVAGGAAYVGIKAQEVQSYTLDKINQVTDWASGAYNTASETIDSIDISGFENLIGSIRNAASELLSQSSKDDSPVNNNSDAPPSDDGVHKSGGNKSDGNGGGGGEDGNGAAAVVLGSALAVNTDSDSKILASEDQIMVLTKKMIEIRNILKRVDQSDTLQLPSIVVIGSQSSGKSSVLEAIVGHEFLPKGNNMVTRRPIELTLINTPESPSEYGEFPSLGFGKITDFTQIQKTLTDLNTAVSDSDAVSDDPIQLNIYSPSVPDLTLIDLPGYIQVTAHDQPESLKQKINLLCEKYIQPPNVILAISAADVDMANSAALKASRRVDPRGERTIGVVTKMDLIDAHRASSLLNNKNYALKMGYVGVITRPPPGGLFRRSTNIGSLVADNERTYFSQYPEFNDVDVGTTTLRFKLMNVLEKTMANSLQPTSEAIRQELEEATYQFKVEYNDRVLTPETYLARSVDTFKLAFKELTTQLGRNEVRNMLKNELDQKILDILAQRYWNKPQDWQNGHNSSLYEVPLTELPKADPSDIYWTRKLDTSTSALTKLGVGRLSTNLVINALMSEMGRLVDGTNFKNHPFARDTINEAASGILNMKFYSTADQVENCIKPYKYEVDIEDREWNKSREHSYDLLKEELRQCDNAYNMLKKSVGKHKLSQVMTFIEKSRSNPNGNLPDEGSDAFGFSSALLSRGREALFLRDRADIIRLRMAAVKSRQCKSKENKYNCPEIFLDVVADKLTQTAVLFLNVELLSDFYYSFPRELDTRLGSGLTSSQIEAFAKEDPKIRNHIELQQRRDLLRLSLEKIESVIELEKTRSRDGGLFVQSTSNNTAPNEQINARRRWGR